MEILRNKNLATRFQILVEIADRGPNVPQLDIARRLDISPQAVSDYMKQLSGEGLITSYGRSRYQLTGKGTNWVIKELRGLKDYSWFVEKAVTNIAVSTAVAESDLSKGQEVGLKMKDGILYATRNPVGTAKGKAFADARMGEDVGITDIEGIISLTGGKITVVSIPVVQEGGSGRVDYGILKNLVNRHKYVGVIGIEAMVALGKLGAEASYRYGVIEAAVEAAKCGLPFLIVSSNDAVLSVIPRLSEEKMAYELVDATG